MQAPQDRNGSGPPAVPSGKPAGRLEGSTISEETVGGRVKYRAKLPCGSVVVSGPVRFQLVTAEEDLVKMEEALESEGGMRAVQRIQPELFRIRDRPTPK